MRGCIFHLEIGNFDVCDIGLIHRMEIKGSVLLVEAID